MMIGVIDTAPSYLNILNAISNCATNNSKYMNTIIGMILGVTMTINASNVLAQIPLTYCYAVAPPSIIITTNYTNVTC